MVILKQIRQNNIEFKMKKSIKNILIIACLSVVSTLSAQQDPQFTQYMYNTMSVNPAYAGSRNHTVINALMRTQWVGLNGAPQSQTLSYDTRLGYSGFGLGVNIVNDRLGPSNETFLDVNGSYRIQLAEEGFLSFGLKLGGRLLNVDWTKGTYKNQNDDVFDRGNLNKFLPTIGAGLYYYTNKWYVGVAVPNFISTDHYDDTKTIVAQERLHYFAIAGYVFDLNENIKFKPAVLSKIVTGAPWSVDVSANFLFNEKFSLGAAWRWDDSISSLLGFQVNRYMHLGYSYDLTTSNYSNYNSGTHELMFRYEIPRPKSLKSPRFF